MTICELHNGYSLLFNSMITILESKIKKKKYAKPKFMATAPPLPANGTTTTKSNTMLKIILSILRPITIMADCS